MAMRKFTKPEENIIKKMVAANEIKELFLAKLIDENIPSIALEWSIDPASFTIFYRSSVGTSVKIFNQIQEIIILLKTLEDEKFIYLHENKEMTKDNRLYNHRIYGRKENGEYYFKMDNPEDEERIVNWEIFKIPTYFGNYVQHYANGIFYVSNALRDLVDNDFKTPEQRRHNQVLFWTQAAFDAAFLGSIITATDTIYRWCSPKDNSLQNELLEIKQTIEQKTLPKGFKTEITNDTLTTKVVEMPKVKLNK